MSRRAAEDGRRVPVEMGGLRGMRYRVFERPQCLIRGAWKKGWVVQLWNGTGWQDVTKPYESEDRAIRVKDMMTNS